ncbi:MAG: WYL domain-containing protein [Chloroflexi bacterium]|nr:WYL domain-containing protein [Chloroflexota bacterium]
MVDLSEQRPSDIPIVILDTETTGLMPQMGHRVVEIGAIRLENWQEVGQINSLIQPGRKMDAGASRVNGISDADLVGQPAFSDIANDLLALLDGALVVAHNAPFDAGFVGMEYFIHSFARQEDFPAFNNPWLCTLQMARRQFYFGRNNLGHIARQLGVRMGRSHRALNDVYTTAEILKRMVHDLDKRGLSTVGDLLHAQGGVIYAPPPPQVFLPDVIREAVRDGRNLRILYLGKNGESRRTITPLYPTQHKGSDYLVAHCHTAHDQRTFKVNRILDAAVI